MMATLEFSCLNLCGELTLSVMTVCGIMRLVGDYKAGPTLTDKWALGLWSWFGSCLGLSVCSWRKTECNLLPALASDTHFRVCFVFSFVSAVLPSLSTSPLNHFPQPSPRTHPAASSTFSAGIQNERPWSIFDSPGSTTPWGSDKDSLFELGEDMLNQELEKIDASGVRWKYCFGIWNIKNALDLLCLWGWARFVPPILYVMLLFLSAAQQDNIFWSRSLQLWAGSLEGSPKERESFKCQQKERTLSFPIGVYFYIPVHGGHFLF